MHAYLSKRCKIDNKKFKEKYKNKSYNFGYLFNIRNFKLGIKSKFCYAFKVHF